MPRPTEHAASARRPRHAAGDPPGPPPHGRHRRPETLADSTRLRPAPPQPAPVVRDESGYPSGEWPAVTRHEIRRVEAIWHEAGLTGAGRAPAPSGPDGGGSRRHAGEGGHHDGAGGRGGVRRRGREDSRSRRGNSAREDSRSRDGDSGRDEGRRRGRHARGAGPRRPEVTVRAEPALPPATAAALPGWAGPTGSHRAPGTLPIESWLSLGRRRRRAALAAAVAAGVLLVAVPMQRQDDRSDPVDPAQPRAGAATTAATPPGQPDSRSAGSTPGSARQPAAQRPPVPGTSAPAPPRSVPAPSGPDADEGDRAGSNAGPSKGAAPNGGGPDATTRRAAGSGPAAEVPPGDGPARSQVTTGSHTVALTFDDGPDPVQTPKMLALLAHYHAKATFCLVGEQVQRHPEIVRQIVEAGHTLCNHTWSHSLTIGAEPPEAIRADLDRTTAAIRRAVPDARIPFFRAPGGNFSHPLVRVAYAGGMTSLYWQVDPRDWDHPPGSDDARHVDRVVADVQRHVRPGAIVLSHDFRQPDTVAAYHRLLPWLTENFELGVPAVPAGTRGTSTGSVPPAGPA